MAQKSRCNKFGVKGINLDKFWKQLFWQYIPVYRQKYSKQMLNFGTVAWFWQCCQFQNYFLRILEFNKWANTLVIIGTCFSLVKERITNMKSGESKNKHCGVGMELKIWVYYMQTYIHTYKLLNIYPLWEPKTSYIQ